MSLRRGIDLEIRIQRVIAKSGRCAWLWEIAREHGPAERSDTAYYVAEDAFNAAWNATKKPKKTV